MPDISWTLDFYQSYKASVQLLVDLLINSHLTHLNQLVLKSTRYRSDQTPCLFDLIMFAENSPLVNLDYYLSPRYLKN